MKPLTKEQRAEMRGRVKSLAREECDPASTILDLIDSHALVDEALNRATAKLATATVCEECGGKGKRLINNCVAGTVASYEIKCPHCTNGVVFDEERARELLERLKRAEEDSGARLIAIELERQRKEEGWTPEHDSEHVNHELVSAACCYAQPGKGGPYSNPRAGYPPADWPWDSRWWKPSEDRIRNLAKAGALIAAEIDRIRDARAKEGAAE